MTTTGSGSFRGGSEGSGGCGARPSGQAVVGLPVVVAVRGCEGSPVRAAPKEPSRATPQAPWTGEGSTVRCALRPPDPVPAAGNGC